MPYWLDWIRRDSRFPLPAEVRRSLPTEEEVRAALAGGADPVALSIRKWDLVGEAVAAIASQPLPLAYMRDLARHIGYHTCGLCLDSIARYEAARGKARYGTDKCGVCPLATVDRCTREGSVYLRLEALLLESPLEVSGAEETSRLGEIADLSAAMGDNLRRLGVSGSESAI